MLYKKNLPIWERVARFLGAVILAFFAYHYGTNAIGIACGTGAIIMILTGLVGYCPMCHIGGRNSVA